MSRTKVRYYPTTKQVQNMINEYFTANHHVVIQDLVENTPFNSFDEVKDAEYNSYWGFDCGWVWVATSNPIQHEEWVKDNGKYDAKVRGIQYPFNCQSVTLKQIQLRKAINDLGLSSQYYPEVRLD